METLILAGYADDHPREAMIIGIVAVVVVIGLIAWAKRKFF